MRNLTYVFCAAVLLSACGGDEDPAGSAGDQPPPVQTLAGDSGKADGRVFEVLDYFTDTLGLDLVDFLEIEADLASDALNAALDVVEFADVEVDPTRLYGVDAVPDERDGVFIVQDIAGLHSDLLRRFGEQDFVAQLNGMRRAALERGDHKYFGESRFRVQLGGGKSFNTGAAGWSVGVGFDAGRDVTATVVAGYDAEIDDILRAPLGSISDIRHWVLPRNVDDLESLTVGESVGLRGQGRVGLNAGASVPVFAFADGGVVTVSARFALGARAQLVGELDIQIMRGEGDDLFVDVGVGNAKVQGAHAALEPSYGLAPIPALYEFQILGREFELGDVADKVAKNVFRKALRYTGLDRSGVRGEVEISQDRVTVNRFRFDLAQRGAELDKAIILAAGGDVRMAQTLADRSDSGVQSLVSLEREFNARRTYVGAQLAGMRWFTEEAERQGTVFVETPDGVREFVIDEISRDTGRWFDESGWDRQVVVAQRWQDGQFVGATSNLRLIMRESDRWARRDAVLDHLDAMLLPAVGFEGLYEQLGPQADQLIGLLSDVCDCSEFDDDNTCVGLDDDCVADAIEDGTVPAWRTATRQAADDALLKVSDAGLAGEFDPASKLAADLMNVKLAMSDVIDGEAGRTVSYSKGLLLLDARITQAGLDAIFRDTDSTQFQNRMTELLRLIVHDRFRKDYGRAKDNALDKVDAESDRLEDLTKIFDESRDEYGSIADAAAIRIAGAPIGEGARVLVTEEGDANEDELTIRTIAHEKGAMSARFVDALLDRANDRSFLEGFLEVLTLGLADPVGFRDTHLVAYTLLSLSPQSERELLVNLEFDDDDAPEPVRAYLRGANADLIEAGEFDLDTLLGR